MKITYYGHGCVEIQMKEHKLLVDPFITPNALAKEIDIETIKPDFILVTHGHMDHVVDIEKIAAQSGATLISNFEIASYYDQKGITSHGMNHGGKFLFDFGWIKYVQAVHSSVLPDGTYAGNPGGFVIWDDDECIYVAGDTALTLDMQLIPLTCPKLDVAVMPIGDNFTMGYEDACIASDFVQCSKVIGCHYDTFAPIEIDKKKAIEHFKNEEIELILLDIGETLTT